MKVTKELGYFFPPGATSPSGPGPPRYRGFIITLRPAILCRTSLDVWSARRRNLYLTTHNTHNRHTSMIPAEFESTISAIEQPQMHALDRLQSIPVATTGIDCKWKYSSTNSLTLALGGVVWAGKA
jgi:hypothetical protein